jgi:hypothetical protein
LEIILTKDPSLARYLKYEYSNAIKKAYMTLGDQDELAKAMMSMTDE